MLERFKGKVAIVTGGASGIGEASVIQFAKEGARVVISDMSEAGQGLSENLNVKGYETIFVQADVTKEEDVKKIVQRAIDEFGSVDVMFANAGIGSMSLLHETDYADFKKVIDVNLNGVFLHVRKV